MLKVLDLFSGIGGFSLGLERTGGFETVAFCEIEPFPRKVLAKRWPEVERLENVIEAEFPNADIITAGFPCQDISLAGKRAGLTGSRSGLFGQVVRAIRLVRPKWALLENVAALLNFGMGHVLGELAANGYDAEWDCVSAGDVGAPHGRDRIWIAASDTDQFERAHGSGQDDGRRKRCPIKTDRSGPQFLGKVRRDVGAGYGGATIWECPWQEKLLALRRVDDGISDGLDAAAVALGNAVVPTIPEIWGRAMLETIND